MIYYIQVYCFRIENERMGTDEIYKANRSTNNLFNNITVCNE